MMLGSSFFSSGVFRARDVFTILQPHNKLFKRARDIFAALFLEITRFAAHTPMALLWSILPCTQGASSST